jgi:hypothetical protein
MRQLTNYDFNKLFKDWETYGGCFSKDYVSRTKTKDGYFYVLNMDDKDGNGTHWILLDLSDKNTNLYYDSFGGYLPQKVEKLLMKSHKDFVMNDIYQNEQSPTSISCGFFVLLICLLRKDGYTPKECINIMNDKNIRGNEKMMEYLYQLIKDKIS